MTIKRHIRLDGDPRQHVAEAAQRAERRATQEKLKAQADSALAAAKEDTVLRVVNSMMLSGDIAHPDDVSAEVHEENMRRLRARMDETINRSIREHIRAHMPR